MIDRDTVIALAKSRDIRALETSDGGLGGLVEPLRIFHISEIQLELLAQRIAQTAVETEREACAKLCEQQHEEDRPSDYAYNIRARGTGGEG